MKVVFALTENSGYDDDPVRHYHFPENGPNRKIATEAIGDWIVYYRTGSELKESEGGRSYVACARVTGVEPSSPRPGYYARITDYTAFEKPLLFRKGASYFESAGIGKRNHWQRSLRRLPDAEFAEIVRNGLQSLFDESLARKYDLDTLDPETRSLLYTGPMRVEREIVKILQNRKIRDKDFQRKVRDAYRNKCAVTHSDMTNGGGRPEVQACHILPVEENGPDVVQNGIALSGTVHWMFDRGLISFRDDLTLLISDNRMPEHLRGVLNVNKDSTWFPPEHHLRPRKDFMEWHRDEKFGSHAAMN